MGLTSRGSAMPLLLLLMLSVVPMAILLWPAISGSQGYRDQVGARLQLARTALIEYAVTYPQNYNDNSAGPGKFPCPDSNGNGSPGPQCPALAIGLLPLGFATAAGAEQNLLNDPAVTTEPLIWVVSGPFRNRPAPSGSPTHAMVLNSASEPGLQLDEIHDAIGLLIAPGPPLAGQVRGAGFQLSDYLEGVNADGDAVFSRTAGNDRVVAIRLADVMPLVERQVLASVRAALVRYESEHGRFPWLAAPTSLDTLGDTHCEVLRAAGWVSTTRYRSGDSAVVVESCEADGVASEQAPLALPAWLVRNFWHTRMWLHLTQPEDTAMPSLNGETVRAVLATAGAVLDPAPSGVSQHVPAQHISDLLDHSENTDGDADYQRVPGGNDQWLTVLADTP